MRKVKSTSAPTIDEMKAEARRLRENASSASPPSHCEALETVARRHGFANWNTARACAEMRSPVTDLRVGGRVSGRYLGHPFVGALRGVERHGDDAFRVSIQFRDPIDVVRFESFSALRRRITAVVRPDGVSLATLSTGEPHLALDSARRPRRRRHARD